MFAASRGAETLTILFLALAVVWFGLTLWKSRGEFQVWDLLFPLLTYLLFGQSFLRYKRFPNLVLFLVLVVGVTWFLLNLTVYGRSVYAIGSNEKAAYWAGVPLKRVKAFVYALMGFFAGLSA